MFFHKFEAVGFPTTGTESSSFSISSGLVFSMEVFFSSVTSHILQIWDPKIPKRSKEIQRDPKSCAGI